jgi:hypothetical protein
MIIMKDWSWLVVRPKVPAPMPRPEWASPDATDEQVRETGRALREHEAMRIKAYLPEPQQRAKYYYRQRRAAREMERDREMYAEGVVHWEQNAVDGADLPAHLPRKYTCRPRRVLSDEESWQEAMDAEQDMEDTWEARSGR